MNAIDQATEEARAALWRRQRAARIAYQTRLWQSLAGNPAAYARLHVRWWPVIAWLAERQEPDVDPEDDYGFDSLGISDTVNVGE